MPSIHDRTIFSVAVAFYAIATVLSIFVGRRGFRQNEGLLIGLLGLAAVFHTTSMLLRGFKIQACPIHNLYEATVFMGWAVVAAYLAVGWQARLRFLGAFAAPLLFTMGVFALMPALDSKSSTEGEFHVWQSIHAALVLLAYGAFGLSAVAAGMYLFQSHNLKVHKARAVMGLLPPIQRVETVVTRLIGTGLILLSAGLVSGAWFLKLRRGSYLSTDPFVLYCVLTWTLYSTLWIAARWFSQRGRRLAWGTALGFSFVILTFWGVWMFSGLHNRDHAASAPPCNRNLVAAKFGILTQGHPENQNFAFKRLETPMRSLPCL